MPLKDALRTPAPSAICLHPSVIVDIRPRAIGGDNRTPIFVTAVAPISPVIRCGRYSETAAAQQRRTRHRIRPAAVVAESQTTSAPTLLVLHPVCGDLRAGRKTRPFWKIKVATANRASWLQITLTSVTLPRDAEYQRRVTPAGVPWRLQRPLRGGRSLTGHLPRMRKHWRLPGIASTSVTTAAVAGERSCGGITVTEPPMEKSCDLTTKQHRQTAAKVRGDREGERCHCADNERPSESLSLNHQQTGH